MKSWLVRALTVEGKGGLCNAYQQQRCLCVSMGLPRRNSAYHTYLRLRFILFMAFCHIKILCSFCTNLARLWRLNDIRIFKKKDP
jgi:hypothetical protein